MMSEKNSKDVILIGAGVLSTTFGTLLKELAPDWNIKLFERLDKPAIESSNDAIMQVLDMLHYVN